MPAAPTRARRTWRAALVLALVALPLVAPASIDAASRKVSASIETGNASCGVDDPNAVVLGTATFSRSNSGVSITVTLSGQPNATYAVAILTLTCTSTQQLGSFVTDARGRARWTTTLASWPDTTGVLDVTFNGTSNRTPTVTFP